MRYDSRKSSGFNRNFFYPDDKNKNNEDSNDFKWEKYHKGIVKYSDERNVNTFRWEKYPNYIAKKYMNIVNEPLNSELNLCSNGNSHETDVSNEINLDQSIKTYEILMTERLVEPCPCPRVTVRVDSRDIDMLFDTG
ncbi:unnamed protein product [Gordionus sp. m RMFG-2023]